MGQRSFSKDTHSSVPETVDPPCPVPATRNLILCDLSPKALNWFFLQMMSIDKGPRVTFYPVPRGEIIFGDLCFLPTAAKAQAGWVWIARRISDGGFGRMPFYESKWLTFHLLSGKSSFLGNWGRRSAAAFAEFCSGIVRGMIAHVGSVLSIRLLAMPRGDCNRCRGFSFSWISIIARMGYI